MAAPVTSGLLILNHYNIIQGQLDGVALLMTYPTPTILPLSLNKIKIFRLGNLCTLMERGLGRFGWGRGKGVNIISKYFVTNKLSCVPYF